MTLTSENPMVVKAGLVEFERDVKAWWAARDYMGCQKVKDIVHRCRLHRPFEQWCIAYAAQASWRDVPRQMCHLLRDTFRGWIQSRVNEKANKVWRDAANRDSASKFLALEGLWERLTSKDVLGEFERCELTPEHDCQESEAVVDYKCLFEDPPETVVCGDNASTEEEEMVDKENAWLREFQGVKDDNARTRNPETRQVLTTELRLLRKLHEENMWHRANDAWLTSLLPVGGLIRVRGMENALFVMKTNEAAALCWPAEQDELHLLRKARNVKELVWYTCLDLQDVQVLRVRPMSPQSLLLQD